MRGSERRPRRLGSVCTTISAETVDEMAAKAATAFALRTDIVELRVDLLKEPQSATPAVLRHLLKKSVVTVRRKDEGGGFRQGEKDRLRLISDLAEASPGYVDVELRTAKENPAWLRSLPAKPKKIVSWHDFSGTKQTRTLRRVREEASALGDIAKLVTTAKKTDDNWKVLKLYEDEPKNLVAFCMGAPGTASRLMSFQLGSPLAYAALPNEPVAPGQLPVTVMAELKRISEETP